MDELERKKNIKEVVEWIMCIIIAVVLALIVRHFVFTPTVVRQYSMESTLKQGDRLVLNRWAITTKQEIKRGEVITFEAPTKYDEEKAVAVYDDGPKGIFSKFVYYVLEFKKESYIKRVIGVAGDHILIENRKSIFKWRRTTRRLS